MQTITTGILSFGMSGRLFQAPFINEHPGFMLYAVTERNTKKATLIYPDIKSYDSVKELINDKEIELVIVNTPNNTHFEYAKEALLAGKHVLIEKPFATSVMEAKELMELAKKKNKYVMAYQNRRWDSDFNSIKQVLESGQLGKLVEVHFRFDRYRKEISAKTFKETPIPGSGVVYDLGPHVIDQVISLFGKPLASNKTTGTYRPNSQVEDYVNYHLMYPNDINVFVTANMLTAHPLPAFVLHGTDGTFIKDRTDVQENQLDKNMLPADSLYGIEQENSEGILTTVNHGNKKSVKVPSLHGDYYQLFDAVFKQLRHNIPYPIKDEEIIWQMELLEQASKS